MEYQAIIIGAGIAGLTVARCLAERGLKVLLLEQRNHIGGNCYDYKDQYGILVHLYGPHIFHTDNEQVRSFLSRFTDWYDFEHTVVAKVGDKLIPVPFNLNTLYSVYPEEKAERMEKILVEHFGEGTRVPIMTLRQSSEHEIREIADYVYQNIFLRYTMKQWGQTPEQINPEVTGRVPIVISRDNRYFRDRYQGVPLHGFTAMFEKMADHPLIDLKLNTACSDVLQINEDGFLFMNQPCHIPVIYTGALDELFGCAEGRLPYRSLHFETEHYDEKSKQGHSVVNYTVDEEFTRITEYRFLTGQQDGNGTTLMKEYPFTYTGSEGEIPYYPIQNDANRELYEVYARKAKRITGLYLLGRLAEYRYYNIDQITWNAMQLADRITERK